jgi:hypothetical protein
MTAAQRINAAINAALRDTRELSADLTETLQAARTGDLDPGDDDAPDGLPDDDGQDKCQCDCRACRDGRCEDCSEPDCDDEHCVHRTGDVDDDDDDDDDRPDKRDDDDDDDE